MHACRGVKAAATGFGQLQRMLASLTRGARHDHPSDPVRTGSNQYIVKILTKGFVGEVSSDIDQVHDLFRFGTKV
jgi:hypothetical protein